MRIFTVTKANLIASLEGHIQTDPCTVIYRCILSLEFILLRHICKSVYSLYLQTVCRLHTAVCWACNTFISTSEKEQLTGFWIRKFNTQDFSFVGFDFHNLINKLQIINSDKIKGTSNIAHLLKQDNLIIQAKRKNVSEEWRQLSIICVLP